MTLHVLMLFILSNLIRKGIEPGRTLLQKLSYFVVFKLRLSQVHDAHYYGPYSPYVEQVLRDLNSLDLIEEESENLSSFADGEFDVKKYKYRLTPKGEETLKEIHHKGEQEFEAVKQCVDTLIDNDGDVLEVISYAAKVHFLINDIGEENEPDSEEISEYAEEFGWSLDETDVDNALEFLEATDFMK